MNLNLNFLRRPASPIRIREDIPMRARDGQFSASPRELERRRRAASVKAQLAVYVETTTPEQRSAEARCLDAMLVDAVAKAVGQ